MALLNWPAALTDVDARAKFQTEDVSKRSEILRDRFEVIMTHQKSTRQWGATSSQQFSVALSLAEELLDLKEARSLTALRSLDKFLSSRMELLTSDVIALAPPQHAAHIIGYVKSMKDSRPSVGSSSSDGVFTAASSGEQSSSQIGYNFKAGNAFSSQTEACLVSKSVCAPLVYTKTHDEQGAEISVVYDVNSGFSLFSNSPAPGAMQSSCVILPTFAMSRLSVSSLPRSATINRSCFRPWRLPASSSSTSFPSLLSPMIAATCVATTKASSSLNPT